MKNTGNRKICFLAHNALGALTGIDTGHVGGIERQIALMARQFSNSGYEVSVITWTEEGIDISDVDGIKIIKLCTRNEGFRFIRFFHPRWTSLLTALRTADADLYYYNCGDMGLGQMVMWTRANKRKTVYSVASDMDCDYRLPVLRSLRERILYRYGIRHVDKIITQTGKQGDMLKAFSVDSEVVPMPSVGINNHIIDRKSSDKISILWVGRISAEKRPEWLLDIAEQCPDYTFDIVGDANTGTQYANSIIERAKGITNVILHGRIRSEERLSKLYTRATLLCNTSKYEGFPNTFLEAWSLGKPVVSSFDPDNIIDRHHLGCYSDSIKGLVECLQSLVKDDVKLATYGQNAQYYFEKNHAVDVSIKRFSVIFEKLLETSPDDKTDN